MFNLRMDTRHRHPLDRVAAHLQLVLARHDLEGLRLLLIGHGLPSLSLEGDDPADVLWWCISRHMQPRPEWLDMFADQLAQALQELTLNLAELVEQATLLVANASPSNTAQSRQLERFWMQHESYAYNLHLMARYVPANAQLFAAVQNFQQHTSQLEFILLGRVPLAVHEALVVQQTDDSLGKRWLGQLEQLCRQDPLLSTQETRIQVLKVWTAIVYMPSAISPLAEDTEHPGLLQQALAMVLDTEGPQSLGMVQMLLETVTQIHPGQDHAWRHFFGPPHVWPESVQLVAQDLWPEDRSADTRIEQADLSTAWWRFLSSDQRVTVRQLVKDKQVREFDAFWFSLLATSTAERNNDLRRMYEALKPMFSIVSPQTLDAKTLKRMQKEDEAFDANVPDSMHRTAAGEQFPKVNVYESYQRVKNQLEAIERLLHKHRWPQAQAMSEQLLQGQLKSQTSAILLSKTAASLATLWQQADRLDEARQWWNKAIDHNKTDPVPLCGLANVLQVRGELTEAETLYRQTIADFPGAVGSRNGLANVLQARGELTEAETLYRQTIANFPGDVVARCGLANVLQARGELTEAETLYRQCAASQRRVDRGRNPVPPDLATARPNFPGDVVAAA